MSTGALIPDIVEATTDSAAGAPDPTRAPRHAGSPAPVHAGMLAVLNAGVVVTAAGQALAAVVSLAGGRVVVAGVALVTLPALGRLRRELRRRLVQGRGGWWPVPFAALATLGTLAAAALWALQPPGFGS